MRSSVGLQSISPKMFCPTTRTGSLADEVSSPTVLTLIPVRLTPPESSHRSTYAIREPSELQECSQYIEWSKFVFGTVLVTMAWMRVSSRLVGGLKVSSEASLIGTFRR